jgi:hypothetical protein
VSTELLADTLAGNTATDGTNGVSIGNATFGATVLADGGGECTFPNGTPTVTSLGYNVAADNTCGLTQPTDHQSTAVTLGPLANNGGPTFTQLAPAASLLVDAIPVGTASLCDGSTPTDQRGVARPQGTACDIGSVERRPTDP